MNQSFWMEPEMLSKYQGILKEIRELCLEHGKLMPKLKNKTATEAEWKRVVEINKRLSKLEDERRKILDANPLRGTNIRKYLKQSR